MSKLIYKIKRTSYPQLLGNLLFEHSDKFQAYNSSIYQKVESNILEKEFCIKMSIFLQFKRLFMTNLIFLLLLFMFNVVNIGTNCLKKEDW